MEKTALNLLFVGSYGAGNLGDDAFKDSISKYFADHDVNFLTGAPNSANEFPHLPFGFRSFLSFHWLRSFRAIWECDVFIFGGGGLWSEEEGLYAMALWTWHLLIARFLRKRVQLWSQSFSFKSRIGRVLLQFILSQAEFVSVRDQSSLQLCNEISGRKDIVLMSDLAFLNARLDATKKTKTIALNFRHDFGDFPVETFLRQLSEKGYSFTFFATDRRDIAMLSRYGDVIYPECFSELVKQLTSFEYCLGMRLHFLIAGALAGAKLVPMAYASKVSSLMKDLNVNVLGKEDWTSDVLVSALGSAKAAEGIELLQEELLDSLSGLKL